MANNDDLRPGQGRNEKDMSTGRGAKDAQMRALKQAHGTPVRQSELPPYISKWKLPVDPKVESD